MKHRIPLLVFYFMLFSGIRDIHAQSYIRINQLGYTPHSVKVAVLVSRDPHQISGFDLVNAMSGEKIFSSQKVKSFGAWGAFHLCFPPRFFSFYW